MRLDGGWRSGAAGCPIAWDVRVADPRRVSARQQALAEWGGAAAAAVQDKERLHSTRLREAGWGFAAPVWEPHGFASPAVRQLLEMLAAERFPAGTPGFQQQRSSAVRAGRRRLALILQAGNAAALLARANWSDPPDEGPLPASAGAVIGFVAGER